MRTALQTYNPQRRLSYAGSDMCLTIPGKVVTITGDLASVEYGDDGVRKSVNISLVKPKLGDYVLVQSGFAIKLLSANEAGEVLEMWKVIRELSYP